ncbi:MAG: hypothetical protein H7Y41_01105 [Hyphomonadaceae bacterium]|nr:hypothetical protein [Clostridia bacterium]
MFIAVTYFNIVIMKGKVRKYIIEQPALEPGYDKIFKIIALYGNIPWAIMGIGTLLGFTNSMFDYFTPRLLNPFVLLFHASIIILYIKSIKGMYFGGGAEFLARHPGIFEQSGVFKGKKSISAKGIKIWFGIMLAGGILGMSAMWCLKIPIDVFTK